MQESQLKQALSYRKFAQQKSKVLVFHSNYLVVDDMIEALESLGWPIFKLPTPAHGEGSSDFIRRLLSALVTFQPDYVLTVNHIGFDQKGILSALLCEYNILLASFFVDHPLPILGPIEKHKTTHTKIFTFERESIAWLKEKGFEYVAYLPSASNKNFMNPEHASRCRLTIDNINLSFAGNSWYTKARVEIPNWTINPAKLLVEKKDGIDRVLNDRFKSTLKHKKINNGSVGLYAVAKTALAEATMRKRAAFAETFSAEGVVVFGDPYWQDLAKGVNLKSFLDYKNELPALFAKSEINLNITASQMPTAINQRVFDVPATGGFLITDAQEDAIELFKEDEEIVVYRTMEEGIDKVRYYRKHANKRRAIASRAQAMIDKWHRYTHRVEILDEEMRKTFNS